MANNRLDVVLLTTAANVRYFSGFDSQFWHSPTRPWYLLIPTHGKPIAVIPEIGVGGMAATWLDDIRTWASPCPQDDGISLLVDVMRSLPRQHGRLGVTLGPESRLRMPLADYQSLLSRLPTLQPTDVAHLMQQLRMVKSNLEIEKISHICKLVSAAFNDLPNTISSGMTEREICRQMRIDLLRRGADDTPYLIAASGPGGYDSIIMGPTDREITNGDLLMLDTGATWDGYFCDFDRNFGCGEISAPARQCNQVIHAATAAGFKAAGPGATTTDIWTAMNAVLEQGGSRGNEVGRLGHGLGLQLTEPPSITASDNTLLETGMVLTLEPGMSYAPGKQIVHEENIVITATGAQWLTDRAAAEIPIFS